MSSSPIYLGIDFAKDKFDYHGPEIHGCLPNTPAGHRRFLARLPQGAHLVCESTGSCHRALVAAAHAAGVAVTVANPRQVRDFARGLQRSPASLLAVATSPAISSRSATSPSAITSPTRYSLPAQISVSIAPSAVRPLRPTPSRPARLAAFPSVVTL